MHNFANKGALGLFSNHGILREVHRGIIFFKSISERGGSDMERLRILNDVILDSKSIEDDVILIQSRIRLFPTLISKIEKLVSELPLIISYY